MAGFERGFAGIGGGPRATAGIAVSSRGGSGVLYQCEPLVLPAYLYAGRLGGSPAAYSPHGLMKLRWNVVVWNVDWSSLFMPRADLKRSANSSFKRSSVLVLHTIFRMWMSRLCYALAGGGFRRYGQQPFSRGCVFAPAPLHVAWCMHPHVGPSHANEARSTRSSRSARPRPIGRRPGP